MSSDTLTVEGATDAPKPDAIAGQFAKGEVDAGAYAQYAVEEKVEGDSLAALKALAEELVTCEKKLAEANAAVVKAKDNLALVQEKTLPDLMEKHGLTKFDFVDATTGLTRTIELVEKWAVSMPPKSGKTADPNWQTKHEAIYNWLYSVGKGSLIKKDLVAPLGLMKDEQCAAILKSFKDANPDIEVTFEKYVEPATLTALISRMKDAGDAVNEFIQVKPRREAKVAAGKQGK